MNRVNKNIISREQALLECPEYVAFVEGDFDQYQAMDANFQTARKGSPAITAFRNPEGLVFVKGKISSVDRNCFQAVDGPVVRFANDEASWRVDGDLFAHIGRIGTRAAKAAVDACIAAAH